MTIEQEISDAVYHMMDLQQKLSKGHFEEMNELYADDFQGMLYMPWVGEVEQYGLKDIKEGNKSASQYYKAKDVHFVFSGLSIVPQSANQAAVSYEVIHRNKEQVIMVRALALEVWRKESDGRWKIIRWYEEKGMQT